MGSKPQAQGRLTTFWQHVRHDVRVYMLGVKVQFKAAAVLRGAFLAQVLGMILNNAALVTAWFFFFDRFGTINGWSMADFIGMQGIIMIVFGVIVFTSTGLLDLPRHVDTGSFDGFLTKPTSVLGQLGSSNIDVTTVGDIILGSGLLVWYIITADVSALAFALFLVALVAASVIFWCFAMLLPYILAFYIFDSERLCRYFGVMFLDAMNYPSGVISGGLRMVLLLALPALLVGAVPLDVLRGLHWEWVGFGALAAVFWLSFTLWLFKRSLRKYESANLVGAR